jgi:uncharacterized protein YdaU (DUF1376 family)
MVLTLEERGAFNTILDLIYSRDGKVPDDARFLARWMGCDVRVWRRVRTRLLDLGKLEIEGTYLLNSRASREVLEALSKVETLEKLGNKYGGQNSKIKQLVLTHTLENERTPTPTPTPRIDSSEYLNGHTQDFERFYTAYPLHKGRGQAIRAFKKAIQKTDVETLIRGAKAYAADPSRKPEFTKHPATWLNAESWADDGDLLKPNRWDTRAWERAGRDWLYGGKKGPSPKLEDFPRTEETP